MNLFLKKLGSFILLSLVVLFAADFIISRVFRDVREPNPEIWRDVMKGEASADILISGDSRVNTDCYPPVIDSITGLRSFSGGVLGNHFTIQKLRYDMYMSHDKKPAVAVQFVDNIFFASMAKFDREQFLPWMWNTQFLKDFFSLEPCRALELSFPWFRYHGALQKPRGSDSFFSI